jgi:hypothetical protein
MQWQHERIRDKISPLGKRKQGLWLAFKLGEDTNFNAVEKGRET